MKTLLSIIAIFILSASVMAGPINITNIQNNIYEVKGVSAAMAMSALNFDMSTNGLQIGLGGGYFESANGMTENAGAIGVGKRVCLSPTSCGIINGSASIVEGGSKGASVGVTWAL